MTKNGNVLNFFYDGAGRPAYFTCGNATYYYVTNLQGDVIASLDSTGTVVVNYHYDAYGVLVEIGGPAAGILGTLNPLTYRGYVYDHETGLYYLQSRYYNPVIKRFISADTTAVLTADLMSIYNKDLYSYCDNNPVVRVDTEGEFWNTIIGAVAGAIVGGISAAVSGTDVLAGVTSGAISGAISGAAIDVAIATGGTGLVAFAGVALASGAGGATGSYVNQRMNGVPHNEVDWGTVAIDGLWGTVGGMLSYGMADVGGKLCNTLRDNLALRGKSFVLQVTRDFITTAIIAAGTWLNGTKMNMLFKSINTESTVP